MSPEQTYFRLEGKDELIRQLQGIGTEVETGVSEALKEVGQQTKDEIRAQIQDGNGFPSEPGQAPNSQTGNLRNRVYYKLDEKNLGQEILLTVGMSYRAFYGFILEYGAAAYAKGFKRVHKLGEGLKNQAKFGARLLPRPFFWPSVERFWDKTPIAVEKAIDKTLKKYA